MTLQKITDLREPPIVGKYYLVPTINYVWDHMFSEWPVMGPLHHDKEIDFPSIHFHVDPRFLRGAQVKKAFKKLGSFGVPNYNSMPIVPLYGRDDSFPRKPTYKKRRCFSNEYIWHHNTTPKASAVVWQKWGDRPQAIHRPDGRMLCPHKKVDLSQFPKDADGSLICPLHGMRVWCDGGKP